MTQNANGCLPFFLWNLFQQMWGKHHVQKIVIRLIGKPAQRFGMGVPIGDIGLDIKDWGSVHQVCAANVEHSPEFRRILDTQQADAGQAQRIGPEGGAGGENTHAGVSSQTGRPYSRGPVLSDCLRKLPDEPKMRKSFYSPQGIWVSVFRLKDDG